jgi:signal transduction histidine kinase
VVVADRTQLEQVVMNLVVNARDAMPDGGTLGLSVEVEGTPRQVVLSVRDTGVGMDEATQAQVFEPFFTTRPDEGGTGLGLATVRSVVDQFGGTVVIRSAPGQGSEFRVVLPASDAG